jgi:hypothetical protein
MPDKLDHPGMIPSIRWPEQFIDPVVLSKTYISYIFKSQQDLKHLFPGDKLQSYRWFERDQPSFILLPLFFLYLSDHLSPNGITPDHQNILTEIMLNMEICAILDDCIDRTPYRSGGLSFYAAYGIHSTPSFLTVLITKHLAMQANYPSLQSLAGDLLFELSERQLWENEHRYPEFQMFEQWLENRYSEVTPAIVYVFHAACLLADMPNFPGASIRLLAEIFQDVDDVVNMLENRSLAGENSDILMGMVTHPLLQAHRKDKVLQETLPQLWEHCRRYGPNDVSELLWQAVSNRVIEMGIPVTLAKIVDDAERAIALCSGVYQLHMQRIVAIFIRRIENFFDLYKS